MTFALSTTNDAKQTSMSEALKYGTIIVVMWWALPLAMLYWPASWTKWPLIIAIFAEIGACIYSLDDHCIGHTEHGTPMYPSDSLSQSTVFACFQISSWASLITILAGSIVMHCWLS